MGDAPAQLCNRKPGKTLFDIERLSSIAAIGRHRHDNNMVRPLPALALRHRRIHPARKDEVSHIGKDVNSVLLPLQYRAFSQPTKQSSPVPFILTDVWKARFLLLLSAALYGTNFTIVKSLNDSMSVEILSTLRFGFAALVMLPWLFVPIDGELKVLAKERRENGILAKDDDGVEGGETVGLFEFGEDLTRLSVGLAGMEIGVYTSVGYIAQAVGLKTTTASKVSCKL